MDFMYQIVLEKENALGNNKFCVGGGRYIFLDIPKRVQYIHTVILSLRENDGGYK